jgi:hypothetical protein
VAAAAAEPAQPRSGAWGVLAAVNVVLGLGAAVVLSFALVLVHGVLRNYGWSDPDPSFYDDGLSVVVWMTFAAATLFAVFAVPVNLLVAAGLRLQGRR